jgi:glyoxylase-like metal-dependent hydrolase (beta-lactamase superfamily II)
VSEITIHRTEHPTWLSNAYLVVNRSQRRGVLIDGNGVSGPLLNRIERDGVDVTAILLTHHHADHVNIDAYRPFDAPILAHPETAALAGLEQAVQGVVDGEVVTTAGMRIEVLHTPGHARDHLAFLVDHIHCFTADVLFRGTVGGTRGPGGSDLRELRRSIERVLALPPETTLHPGHRESTTVGEELATNPFVLAWRANGATSREACTVLGEPAELLLWGPDYDGTNKAWVRLADGSEHIVGGSQVTRGATQQ